MCDGGEGIAAQAAARLADSGYSDISVLEGGVQAWAAQDGVLFSGTNVPSKAFGEHVEHVEGTPSLSADELDSLVKSDEDVLILDSRPLDEYRVHSIPGGICVPGAELAYRVHDLRRSPIRASWSMRRANPEHHRRAVPDQCRGRQRRLAAKRHDGVAPRRPRARSRCG